MSRKDRKDRAGLRPAIIDLKASEVTPDPPAPENRPADDIAEPVPTSTAATDESPAATKVRADEERAVQEAPREEP